MLTLIPERLKYVGFGVGGMMTICMYSVICERSVLVLQNFNEAYKRNYKWVDFEHFAEYTLICFTMTSAAGYLLQLRQLTSDRKAFGSYLTYPFIIYYVTLQMLCIIVYMSVGNEGIKETILDFYHGKYLWTVLFTTYFIPFGIYLVVILLVVAFVLEDISWIKSHIYVEIDENGEIVVSEFRLCLFRLFYLL